MILFLLGLVAQRVGVFWPRRVALVEFREDGDTRFRGGTRAGDHHDRAGSRRARPDPRATGEPRSGRPPREATVLGKPGRVRAILCLLQCGRHPHHHVSRRRHPGRTFGMGRRPVLSRPAGNGRRQRDRGRRSGFDAHLHKLVDDVARGARRSIGSNATTSAGSICRCASWNWKNASMPDRTSRTDAPAAIRPRRSPGAWTNCGRNTSRWPIRRPPERANSRIRWCTGW
jgi:hypothetical protein